MHRCQRGCLVSVADDSFPANQHLIDSECDGGNPIPIYNGLERQQFDKLHQNVPLGG
jgi:hypothetical protein